jgi:hypothetical protein
MHNENVSGQITCNCGCGRKLRVVGHANAMLTNEEDTADCSMLPPTLGELLRNEKAQGSNSDANASGSVTAGGEEDETDEAGGGFKGGGAMGQKVKSANPKQKIKLRKKVGAAKTLDEILADGWDSDEENRRRVGASLEGDDEDGRQVATLKRQKTRMGAMPPDDHPGNFEAGVNPDEVPPAYRNAYTAPYEGGPIRNAVDDDAVVLDEPFDGGVRNQGDDDIFFGNF